MIIVDIGITYAIIEAVSASATRWFGLLFLVAAPLLWGCPVDEEGCSLERCEVWVCGEPRPDCPCGDLCERPECSDMVVFGRDPEDGTCHEFSSSCEVPESWEYFEQIELCEVGLVMCSSTSECAEGEVCDLTSCALDAVGTCAERPEVCPEEEAPVFDCAGETHVNDCERLRAGARLGGIADVEDSECTDGGVWARDPASGACSYFASSCFSPEGWPYFFTRTACDGPICSTSTVWVYDSLSGECVEVESDCEVSSGVEFFTAQVACAESANRCGGAAGDCSEGMFCDISSCSSQTGECVPLPDECMVMVETTGAMVCGCDGITYFSDCERLLAGVALAYLGQCG